MAKYLDNSGVKTLTTQIKNKITTTSNLISENNIKDHSISSAKLKLPLVLTQGNEIADNGGGEGYMASPALTIKGTNQTLDNKGNITAETDNGYSITFDVETGAIICYDQNNEINMTYGPEQITNQDGNYAIFSEELNSNISSVKSYVNNIFYKLADETYSNFTRGTLTVGTAPASMSNLVLVPLHIESISGASSTWKVADELLACKYTYTNNGITQTKYYSPIDIGYQYTLPTMIRIGNKVYKVVGAKLVNIL